MPHSSRRDFAKGVATIPFALWLEKFAFAQTTMIRPNALSYRGQAMLRKYAQAVATMQNGQQTPEANPLSWLFQWYTHAVRPDRTKAGEIQRIYTNPQDPHRALAQDTWSTCQAHFNPA